MDNNSNGSGDAYYNISYHFFAPESNENEDNKIQNELNNSGDNEIINSEEIIDSSGDVDSGDEEILDISSGDVISGDENIMNGDNYNTNEYAGETNNEQTPINTNDENVSDTVEESTTQVETPIVIEQINSSSDVTESENTETVVNTEIIETVENNLVIPEGSVGMIAIPKISLNTPVLDGHSLEVLKNGLGHVDATAYWQGNIGILGHNSGSAGYFQNLTKLVIGDAINYTTEYGTRNYKVTEITQIEDTDWSYLANTKDNRITLITCVKGVPEKRLCIQAVQI